jgi:hypothetical protein
VGLVEKLAKLIHVDGSRLEALHPGRPDHGGGGSMLYDIDAPCAAQCGAEIRRRRGGLASASRPGNANGRRVPEDAAAVRTDRAVAGGQAGIGAGTGVIAIGWPPRRSDSSAASTVATIS